MADKYIEINGSGDKAEREVLDSSAGAGDAGKLIGLDSTGRIDPSMMPVGVGADIKNLVTSEDLSAGDLVNVWDDSGTVKARKADASTSGKEAIGFVLAAVVAPAAVDVYFEGVNTQLTGLTKGAKYWLSDTVAGGVTTTPPADTGEVLQRVGFAVSDTELSFEPMEPIIRA